MSPEDVEDGGADQRIFDEERIEERRRLHDHLAQEDFASARHVARQLPQAQRVAGFVICGKIGSTFFLSRNEKFCATIG